MKRLSYLLSIALVATVSSCKDDNAPEPLSAEFTADRTTVNAGETVFFMDRSSGNPVRWDWEFEGGEPATSQCFSPEIVFAHPGTYKVKLTVGRGENNSVKEVAEYITVAYPDEIIADFAADKTQALSDETITFTDLSAGFPETWEWIFTTADGKVQKSSDQNPSLIFEPGLYSVTLNVTNPNAKATITKTDYLNIIDRNSVAAEFSASTRMGVEGVEIQFNDETLGRPTNWNWTFEGATPATSSERNPKVKFTAAGKYKITLTASNEVNTSTCEKEEYIMILPKANLVLFYPFEGDCKDASDNGINAEIMRAGESKIDFNAPSRHAGMSAARFSGTSMDNYEILSIPDHTSLQFGSGASTRVFWINTSNKTSSNLAVFHQGSGPGARTDNANRQTWFRLQKSSPYFRYVIEYTGLAGNWTDYKTKALTDGEWHCVICVHEKGSTWAYVDGVKACEALNKVIKDIDNTPFFIGCNYRYKSGALSFENFFDGYIDDFMIYNRAFTADEAKQLYDIMK